MPVGKSRNSKRSATTSYASTITTVIFIALCVVGVWMLTSNSLVPPEPTAKTSTRTTAGETNAGAKSRPQKPERTNESSNENNEAQFEDDPGKLPDDAIKSDEVRKSQQSKENEVLGVEEHGHGLQGIEHAGEKEKQKQGETQLSEESIMTQSQEAEHTVSKNDVEDSEISGEKKNEDSENSGVKKSENEKEESKTDPESENREEKQTEKAKEYEKEQREQREEDAGNQKNSEEKTEEEGKQNAIQQNEQEKQETEQEQKQQSNTEGMTFTDSTREEQPTDQGFSKEATETDKSSTKAEQKTESSAEQSSDKSSDEQKPSEEESSAGAKSTEPFPSGGSSEIPKESSESKKSWKTQAGESKNEKKRQKDESEGEEGINEQEWLQCNTSAGPDYIPCLDNEKAIAKLRSRRHFEHRERHCPEDAPMCLVPLPDGYKEPIKWPKSRNKIWYHNVPHTKLADVKGHQNWVKVTGEFLTFPGGGTQFIHGALHYIDFLQQSVPNIGWGKHSRVLLDVGCGVASFGGFLFERDVLAMSLAPKDEHEAQVQFALERGIPAISAVMGTQRLPFPSRVFDVVHCARCRVPWHNDGGMLLLELNRVLRPGGYFVWSATPVYQKLQEDQEIWEGSDTGDAETNIFWTLNTQKNILWKLDALDAGHGCQISYADARCWTRILKRTAMSSLTKSMCWDLVNINKDKLNGVGAAIYRKPNSNQCYEKREQNQPPICNDDDDANAAWYVPLQACMHKVPVNTVERGSKWPENWPRRLQTPPYWLNGSQMGIYGKPAPQDFTTDNEHWKQQVSKVYMNELGINWSNVRNVMDMRAVYGGFAAALKDLKVWVMNVVNINSPDTLPIIYERGLFGIYHDWCESFSTYPRSYDLLHADHLISKLKERCKLAPVMAEVDRIVRPGGKLIVRDESNVIREVENLLKSLHWDVHLTFSKNHEGILSAQKGNWRPKATEASA